MSLKAQGITNFSIKELVHPHVYDSWGEERIIHFLDLRVFRGWQWIRSQRGNPIFMNTWGINVPDGYPEFVDRGLRWPGKSNAGSITSQHYFGRAGDGDEPGTPAKELYEWILKPDHQKALLDIGVTTIEDIDFTETWIHLDCRNWGHQINELQIVQP